MKFDNLPLHDAILAAIHISWEADRCDFRVCIGGESYWLVFEGFSNLEFPKREPWEPSRSINAVRETVLDTFEIELQSGDILRISAAQWSFRDEQGKSVAL